MSKSRAILSLMRLRLLPSAITDVLAGAAIAGGVSGPLVVGVVRTVLASGLIYSAGMVLNDVADAERDRELAPTRAIPSGLVSRRQAAVLGFTMLALGLAVVPWPLPGVIAAVVVALVVAYDFGCTRRPRLGAPVLGLCRAGNVSLGVAVAGGAVVTAIPILACYAVYVGCAVGHGALEDREPDPIASRRLVGIACAVGLLATAFMPQWWLAAVAALPTCFAVARVRAGSEAFVARRTGALLRGLSRFGFGVTVGFAAWVEAAIVFVLAYVVPLALGRRRWS